MEARAQPTAADRVWIRIGSFFAAAIVLTVLLGAVVLWSALGADVWRAALTVVQPGF